MRWNPNSESREKLTDRLRRPDIAARIMAEIMVTEAEDVQALKSDWDAGTQSTVHDAGGDFETFLDGSVRLKSQEGFIFQFTASDGFEQDLDDAFPIIGIDQIFTGDVSSQIRFRNFKAFLNKNVSGVAEFDGVFAVQVYGYIEHRTRGSFLTPLLSPVAEFNAVDMASDTELVTFDFREYGLTLQDVPTIEIPGDFEPGFVRRIFITVFAIPVNPDTGDEAINADNVGWGTDSANQGGETNSFGGFIPAKFSQEQSDGSWKKDTGPFPRPRCELAFDQYGDPSLGFATLEVGVDLGAVPTAENEVEFELEHSTPSGAESIFEVSDDGGTNWFEFASGDRAEIDLPNISKQQTYKLRWQTKATPDRAASAALFKTGPRSRKVFDVSDLISVNNLSRWAIDPINLEASVGEAQIEVARDGVRDFNDLATRIVTENEFADTELRVWIGHPDLARSEWGLVEVFRIDDRLPTEASERFIGVSVLEQVKGLVPPFDSAANRRIPVTYENETLEAVINDIIDVQRALPSKYRGPLLEGETDLVTKTLIANDALTEAAALSYIAGKGITASQGRVKAVNVHGAAAPVAVFQREEVEVLRFDPGYRRRQPEMFVKYGLNHNQQDKFAGEVRDFNPEALAKLGPATIEQEPISPPDAVEEWLPVDVPGPPPRSTLAEKIASRIPKFTGTGLILAQIATVYPNPWLEVGDMVAFRQDVFTGRDPITGREIKGSSWVIGVIVEQYNVWGNAFLVWVRGYSDIVTAQQVIENAGQGIVIVWAEDISKDTEPSIARYGLHAWPRTNTTIYWLDQDESATVPARSPTGVGWNTALPGDEITVNRDPSLNRKLSLYGVGGTV